MKICSFRTLQSSPMTQRKKGVRNGCIGGKNGRCSCAAPFPGFGHTAIVRSPHPVPRLSETGLRHRRQAEKAGRYASERRLGEMAIPLRLQIEIKP